MLDCASITIGIIIGSGIYEAPARVAERVTDPWWFLAVWGAGGLFALVGAWCYAELATRHPEQGGDYVYLSRAFGRPIGLLFAWTQLWVIRPGSIGAMGCVFAVYAIALQKDLLPSQPPGDGAFLLYACGSIVVLSLVNMLGVPFGKNVQNLLTVAKVLGLSLLVVAGLSVTAAPEPAVAVATGANSDSPLDGLTTAMIFVLFAYSGWNEIGCVTSEVRDPQRSIGRSLLLAAAVVTAIYVGINLACLNALGLPGIAASAAVPTDVAQLAWGRGGAILVSALICISALGSTNGMIFTGARIYYALGRRHALFAPLGLWSRRFGTPWVSLLVQGAVTAALVVGFSRESTGVAARYDFGRLVMFMTPPFYLFLALSAAAVVVFRLRRDNEAEAYRSPLFPLAPLAMGAGSIFLTWRGCEYAYDQSIGNDAVWWPALWVAGTFATGIIAAVLDRNRGD